MNGATSSVRVGIYSSHHHGSLFDWPLTNSQCVVKTRSALRGRRDGARSFADHCLEGSAPRPLMAAPPNRDAHPAICNGL